MIFQKRRDRSIDRKSARYEGAAMILSRTLLLFLLVILLPACNQKTEGPAKDYFSPEWAMFMHRFPGGDPRADRSRPVTDAIRLESEALKLYKTGKYAEAIKAYEMAFEQYTTGQMYYNYGNSLSNLNRLEDAIKAYSIAISLSFDHPELALYNSACAYSRLRNAESAYTLLGQAIDSGYDAFKYVESDPDMEFLRSQPDWRDKIKEMIPVDVKYGKDDLIGYFNHYVSRGASYTVLCAGGVYLNYETANFETDLTRGHWHLDGSDLVLDAAYEECRSHGKISNQGVENTFGGCQRPMNASASKMSKSIVGDMLTHRHVGGHHNGVYYTWTPEFKKFSGSEPLQCDPSMRLTKLEDLEPKL